MDQSAPNAYTPLQFSWCYTPGPPVDPANVYKVVHWDPMTVREIWREDVPEAHPLYAKLMNQFEAVSDTSDTLYVPEACPDVDNWDEICHADFIVGPLELSGEPLKVETVTTETYVTVETRGVGFRTSRGNWYECVLRAN